MSTVNNDDPYRPVHDGFMDQEMREFWRSLTPLPGGLRLYGGTALAMYLNHRQSTDFDFATPLPVVDPSFVKGLPGLSDAQVNGGDGMVDGVIKGRVRDIRLTFMECGSFLPQPTHSPIAAKNGVLVAHPADLIASKAQAMCSRGALRDYLDLAACLDTWPQLCRDTLCNPIPRTLLEVARSLSAPPIDTYKQLEPRQRALLANFAQHMVGRERGR